MSRTKKSHQMNINISMFNDTVNTTDQLTSISDVKFKNDRRVY